MTETFDARLAAYDTAKVKLAEAMEYSEMMRRDADEADEMVAKARMRLAEARNLLKRSGREEQR